MKPVFFLSLLTLGGLTLPLLCAAPETAPQDAPKTPNEPLNLALKKPATAIGGNAAAVVDGNTGGEFFKDAVLEATGQNPWWQVDLGAVSGLDDLKIWNRSDCCSNRLRQFWIFVSDTPFESNDLAILKNQAGVWSRFSDGTGGFPSTFHLGTNGRFVRVQLTGNDALDLAEVQVFGSPPRETALGAEIVAPPSSVVAGGSKIVLRAKSSGPAEKIEFRADAETLGTATKTAEGYELAWTAREGTHFITATALDARGNRGAASQPLVLTVSAAPVKTKIPVILDTDIGGDSDDTFALAMLLGSPEFDIKLVTTDGGNGVEGRANRVAEMLTAANRTDIPIGVGVDSAYQNVSSAQVAGSVKYAGQVFPDGVGALIKTIRDSPTPITLICISPLQNIGVALKREPKIAENARVVAMWGAFRRGALETKTDLPEHNVTDLPGSRAMLAAPWDITTAPIETAGTINWHGELSARIRDSQSPKARELWKFWQGWGGGSLDIMSLYDTEAVYLAFASETDQTKKLEMRRFNVRLTDDGFTVKDDAAGRPVNVALTWRDPAAFNDLAVGRITLDAPK